MFIRFLTYVDRTLDADTQTFHQYYKEFLPFFVLLVVKTDEEVTKESYSEETKKLGLHCLELCDKIGEEIDKIIVDFQGQLISQNSYKNHIIL